MKAQFKFLSGARVGQTDAMTKSYIGLGRHPLSDVRFDAERDLDVSARHAAVVQRGAAFIVQDLGSKNGTFVNGKRVEGELQLKDGDVIGCGAKGPAVEFRILDGNGAPSTVAEQAAARGSEPRAVVPAQAPLRDTARGSTGVRIAVEVAKQTRQLRNTTKVLFVLLIIAAGAFIWLQQKSNQESHEVMLRADSLAAQVHQQLETVQRALRESQTEVTRLSSQLEAARSNGNTGAIGRLRAALDSAEARQRGISGAAAVDYRGISQRNQDAVALVLVEFDNGDRYSGTAFSIDSQGTLVTNKHVLAGEEGNRTLRRIAVKFSGSRQWFQGRLVGVADDADVGVLKVDIQGGTPRVAGLVRDPRSLERGDPVAIIGYPLGFDLPMEGEGLGAVAEPTLTSGLASKVLREVVQVDAFAAPGSSGSPIFDRSGRVVAVLYGGQTESNGKIVFAVPVSYALSFLSKQGIRVP